MAAAQVAGRRYLLSEDMHAGGDYDGVEVLNPFATGPATWFEAGQANER